MLVDFRVKNFALIDELEIHFTDGLNVMTGETGAGKSIIIGALEILLGARASTDLIRNGKDSAYIEAAFEPERIDAINSILIDAGIEPEANMVLLSREVRQNGNNRNRINGQLATAGMIKDISKYLVDIHGQHEHQRLLDHGSQLVVLDEFIAYEEYGLTKKIKEAYIEISEIERKLSEFNVEEAEKAREIDLLEFQIDEIAAAQLKENEIEDLDREFKIMANMEDIYAVIGELYNNINGEEFQDNSGLINQIGLFMKKLEDIKEYDEEINEFHDVMSDIFYQVEDLSFRLNNYHEKLEFDQEKLDKIENRLSHLANLQRKYGQTVEDIMNYQAEMEERLNNLLSQDKFINKLQERKDVLLEEYYDNANKLSKLRKNKALELEKIVSQELADLAMEKTKFKIQFSEKSPSINGIDRVDFLIAPNPGEDLKPLSRIASGGELSRIMLALKTIIAHIDEVDTLIFDEVDAGVGGKVAQMMAEKLAIIGKKRQVLCITHLPQIASMADNHFFITKEMEDERTYTNIYNLEINDRKEELARMLGGVELTDTTIKHAEEMLTLAEQKKEELL
ncbi:MAG: DNA repair protein RecN [Halanaerobiales bacterium]